MSLLVASHDSHVSLFYMKLMASVTACLAMLAGQESKELQII